jgi:creatinine amidohydrolase
MPQAADLNTITNAASQISLHKEFMAVLPLGAHEQHGPHLPFETDRLIVEGVVDRLKARLSKPQTIHFLPAEAIGYSIEHMDVEGSKTLSYDGAIRRWLSIIEELHGQGIRKVLLLNAHGGNSPLLTIIATEARVRFNMLVVASSWTRFGVPDGLISPEDKALDIHGGFIETSVMLALHPSKVDMAKAEDFTSRQSQFAQEFKHLRAYGPHAFGWKMSDLNPIGVAGNAARANSEAGEKLLDHAVDGLCALINDIAAFDISIFDAGTLEIEPESL